MPKKDREYQQRGTLVYATISEVHPGIKGHTSYVCQYTNNTGKTINAQLILNKLHGEYGQVVEGYYLPEEPTKVYCLPSKLFTYGLIIVIDAIAILLTLITIVTLFSKDEQGENTI